MAQSSADTQISEGTQLVNTLMDFQVGIRKISMYGLSHSIVPKIALSLREKFLAILEVSEPLILVIGKNELLYQALPVSPENVTLQELSRTLHRLNIIQVTFKKGLTDDAILKFFAFILKNRAKTFTQDDTLVAKFHEDAPTISLQLVTFKDAISQQGDVQENTGAGNIWQNLVNHTGDLGLPEAVRRLISADADSPADNEAVASAINALYAETGLKKETYESSVLAFLKDRSPCDKEEDLSDEVQGTQNLGEIFSKLRVDVRAQVFKLSMQTQDDQLMPLENFLSHMPVSLFPEILQQMDLSHSNLAPPEYRILKKVATLGKDNVELTTQLREKLQGHEALRDELMLEKKKTISGNPMQDFSKKMAYTEGQAFSDAEVAHQLALTLPEVLAEPTLPETQLEGCLTLQQDLLLQGIGDDTLEVLINTIQVLLKNFGTTAPDDKPFWRAQLLKMLSPQIVVKMLKMRETLGSRADLVLNSLVSIAGDDFFRVVLHVLEVEKHLSTRKQALRFLIACGPDVIPLTVSQLKNPQWFIVRNMLVILKDVHAVDEVLEIIPFVKHKVEQVRLAALQALGAIAPETDLLVDALGITLRDRDENVSKAAISMLIASRHSKASVLVRNFFMEAEDKGKWRGHQLLLLKEMGKSGSRTWLPTLLQFRKGFFFMLLHWGQRREIQSAIRKAMTEIEKKG
ncbi:MAG: hypothetical protein GXO96_11760 [Nitrospirae bacterium]|nr:hypothetical protein [Candidatus Manganitrophaceae bacterium]